MTASNPSKTQAPTPNAKQQLEATVTRFWTSVTAADQCKGNHGNEPEEISVKIPGVPLFTKKSDEDESQVTPKQQASPLQAIVTSMFASCTTGMSNFDERSTASSDVIQFKTSPTRPPPPSSLLKHTRSRSTVRTFALTATSGEGEAVSRNGPLHPRTPSSAVKAALQESKRELFQNKHDVAEEAIERLRQQHKRDQTERDLNFTFNDPFMSSAVAIDSEMAHSVLSHEVFSMNPSTLSLHAPSTLSNNRTITSSLISTSAQQESLLSMPVSPTPHQQQQPNRKSSLSKFISPKAKKNEKESKVSSNRKEHSFFPVSKPSGTSRQERRLKAKLLRNKGVPKEVTPTSPIRLLKNGRDMRKQKRVLNSTVNLFGGSKSRNDEDRDMDESWDMANDGISDITQETVDKMVLAITKHLHKFPEEAENLNRVHSDLTDPAPERGTYVTNNQLNTSAEELFPYLGGKNVITPPRGEGMSTKKGMTPPSFSRNVGSMGTRTFFTKTTQSTNDFANAWAIDEQEFWATEVAKESKNQFNKTRNMFEQRCSKNNIPTTPNSRKLAGKKKSKRSGHTTTSTITTAAPTLHSFVPSPPSSKPVVQKFPHQEENKELFLPQNGRMVQMAEI